MKTRIALALIACGLSAVVSTRAGDSAPPAGNWKETLLPASETFTNIGRNACFILEPGYQLTYAGKDGGKQTDLVITVLDETKQINGVSTRIVEERESSGGKLVEVSRNYFVIGTSTGHAYYFGEDVDMFGAGGKVTHEGSWREGDGDAQHGIAMPADAKKGERYYQERAPGVAMDRAEIVSVTTSVKTPAGTFKNCVKTKETTPLEPGNVEYKVYAPGIGLAQDGDLKLVTHGFVKK